MSNTVLLKRSSVAAKVPTTAAMSLGEIAINTYDGALYLRGNNGADFVRQIGGSAYPAQRLDTWQPVSGLAPVQDFEFDESVFRFSTGNAQAITAWIQASSFYTAGRQITLRIGVYSPSTSNVFRVQAVATLVRAGTDAVTSTTNQNSANTGDVTLATANLFNKLTLALTSASGTINLVAVSPGDLIKVVLSRVTPAGTDDTADLRVIPNSGEVQF